MWSGSGGGGSDSGDTSPPCPNVEAYEDAADTVGIFTSVLGVLKDSPFSLSQRDDNAINAAVISLNALELSLISGSISLDSVEGVLSGIIEVLLNEASDTAIIGIGTMAGAGVAWWVDGPLPVGEVLGGIVGAIGAYASARFISHKALADALAGAMMDRLDLENVPGPCSNG